MDRPCRVCGGGGFVAYKRCIDDGYGDVDSCPACSASSASTSPARKPFGFNIDDHHESCNIRTSRDGWDARCDCGVLS